VVVLLGSVEREGVLEAGAAAAANRDPEGLLGGVLLIGQQLSDLRRRVVGQLDRLGCVAVLSHAP
jgi:hypothetical protein